MAKDVVCQNCKAVLGKIANQDGDPVSYGVCTACASAYINAGAITGMEAMTPAEVLQARVTANTAVRAAAAAKEGP